MKLYPLVRQPIPHNPENEHPHLPASIASTRGGNHEANALGRHDDNLFETG